MVNLSSRSDTRINNYNFFTFFLIVYTEYSKVLVLDKLAARVHRLQLKIIT